MGWSYHFADLTKEQKHERRQLLDWYGSLAQVSVFVPLLVIQCFFLAAWLSRRWRAQDDLETPSSPYAKEQRLGMKRGVRDLRASLRKLAWWAGDSTEVSGYCFGTKGEVLGAVLWTVWLLLLCFLQTGDDYLHLTKRFGTVASSQLPFQYLLAFKSPYSPLQILTRSSHETLNNLHQHLGRITTLLLYIHAAFYINFYVISNLLAAKIQEAYVICGIVGVVAFTAVGTTALSPIRKLSYRLFYIMHVTLATALLPVLYFHVSHIRIYLYETAMVYAISAVLRTINTQSLPGSIRLVPDTALIEITIPFPKASSRAQVSSGWQPGQHAYVSLAGHPFLRTFKSNPFTVASIPAVDGNLRFIAKVLDGNTAKLARSANDRKVTKMSQTLSVEGPYGVATHADRLLGYDRILLIAGGVGATFIVPIYRQLLADLSPSKGSYRRQRVSFVWAARSKADVTWALPTEVKEREGFVERLEVYLTSSMASDVATPSGSFTIGVDDEDDKAGYGEPEDGIELEEQKTLLSGEADGTVAATASDELPIRAGRPNVTRLIDQTFSHGGAERVAVVVCGPRSLGGAVRKEVGRFVSKGREVWFWEESFAF